LLTTGKLLAFVQFCKKKFWLQFGFGFTINRVLDYFGSVFALGLFSSNILLLLLYQSDIAH